jgi:NTE family protein
LIQQLDVKFASVATDLKSGREEWIVDGPLVEAVWASISLPGLFPAIQHRQTWLVDGGLVNPVPVSVCRALGADVVIAVNLNGDIVGKHFDKRGAKRDTKQEKDKNGVANKLTDMVREYTSALFPSNGGEQAPSLFDAIAGSFNITQDRITRSRLAGDPPDIILTPRLSHIGLLEFYRAAEAIKEGGRCVARMQEEIESVIY